MCPRQIIKYLSKTIHDQRRRNEWGHDYAGPHPTLDVYLTLLFMHLLRGRI